MSHFGRQAKAPRILELSRHPGGADAGAWQADHAVAGPPLPTDPAGSDAWRQGAERAIAVYRTRRRRDQAFGEDADLFNDPAWDILLDLFHAEASASRVSITDAASAPNIPLSTGLRMIRLLEQRGMIERRGDPFDGRRSYLQLTAKARDAMFASLASS